MSPKRHRSAGATLTVYVNLVYTRRSALHGSERGPYAATITSTTVQSKDLHPFDAEVISADPQYEIGTNLRKCEVTGQRDGAQIARTMGVEYMPYVRR